MRSFCRALLVLNVLYCLLAVAQEGLPGWHMFESVERLDYTLRDNEGREVNLAAYLPRGARLVDHTELAEVVRFVCERSPSRAPFTFDEPARGVHATLGPSDCALPGPRRAPR